MRTASRAYARRSYRRRIAAVALGLAVGASGAGCRSATEITLRIHTDMRCRDSGGTTITVGLLGEIELKAPIATTEACDSTSGTIGTIVLVPSGASGDEVAVKVVTGLDRPASQCLAPDYGPGCIVARRSLRYIPHTALELDIFMAATCSGVRCEPSETCDAGTCVSATIDDPEACATGPCGPSGPPVTAAQACGDTAGLAPGAAYPTSGLCPTRIGRSRYRAVTSPSLRWRLPAGAGAVVFPPAIAADGTIYYGDPTGPLVALDPTTGHELWRFDQQVGGTGSNTPTLLADGSVLHLTSDQFTFILVRPPATPGAPPAEIWRWQLGTARLSAPFVDRDGRVYCGAADGSFHALGPDGHEQWAVQACPADPQGLAGASMPAVGHDGNVYFGCSDGSVHGLDAQGQPVLSTALGAAVRGSPTVGEDGTVYVGSDDGKLHALAPDGSEKWSYLTRGAVRTTPAIGPDETVLTGGGESSDRYLYALGPDGDLRWEYDAGGWINFAPTIDADGVAYVATQAGVLHAVGPDGQVRWTEPYLRNEPWDASTPAIAADGTIWIGTWEGDLVAFGL
jgi:outer membrane protein assembly factor BamB